MYDVYLFFDNQFRGLSDSIHNLEYDLMCETVHNYASQGGYIRIRNNETGVTLEFDSDTYFNSGRYYYEGDINIDI